MSLTVVKGLQSEIFVPITPPAVWAPVTKEIKDMSVALATAAGVHKKSQETKTSTVCSRSTESMNLLQKDLSEHVLRYMQDSWAAVETRRNLNTKLVRP